MGICEESFLDSFLVSLTESKIGVQALLVANGLVRLLACSL
jgi:hypothetical protein